MKPTGRNSLENYLDVLPLDVLRAEFMAYQYGGIGGWLPQWSHALLEKKDVGERFKNHASSPDGAVEIASVEKCHHMFELGLLHDLAVGLIVGTKTNKQFYGVQDKFGMTDFEFFGYWDNHDLIGEQTTSIKASTYPKPNGDALVVVYNTTRNQKTVDWGRLKLKVLFSRDKAPLQVVDAYTKEDVMVNDNIFSLEVPPLNYRLLWVR